MTNNFSGSHRPLAIVTGAAGGIGLACASRFAPNHDLLLCDLDLIPEIWSIFDEKFSVRFVPWQPEEENVRLKRLVANLSLDKEMLQDVIRRKM